MNSVDGPPASDDVVDPAEKVLFPGLGTTDMSKSSLSSRQSSPRSDSPTNNEDHLQPQQRRAFRTGPIVLTPNSMQVQENEKLLKMKKNKQRKENSKEKNVKASFQTEAKDYNVDTVLALLGEVESKNSLKKAANNKAGGPINNAKSRRRSNEKSTDKDNKDQDGGEEEESDSSPQNTITKSNSMTVKEMLVDFSENFVLNNNVTAADSTNTCDLKRQTSRSTENLSSFTKVTSKKQKWQKKKLSSDDSENQHQQQQMTMQQRRNYNLRSSRGGGPENNGESSSSSSTASSSIIVAPRPRSQLTQSHSFDTGRSSLPPRESEDTNSIDLTADFPPLASEEVATTASSSSLVWVTKPSHIKNSDHHPSAVIDFDCENNNSVVPPPPPDVTVRVQHNKHQNLPDIASNAPQDSGCTSSSGTSHLSSSSSSGGDQTPPLSCSNSSYFVDDNKVEIVLTEEAYLDRGQLKAAPVTIFGQGDTPVQDWSTCGGLEFGFDINQDLLDGQGAAAAAAAAAASSSPKNNNVILQHQPLLHHEDGAIVSFGASLDQLEGGGGGPKELLRCCDDYDIDADIVSPESGISSASPLSWQAEQNNRGASPVLKWNEQDDDDAVAVCNNNNDSSHNYIEILQYVAAGWRQVERELKNGKVFYYNNTSTTTTTTTLPVAEKQV